MFTRILVVKPMFSVVVDESDENGLPGETNCCAANAASAETSQPVAANGQILAALAALLQKAATALPVILPEILQLIAVFGGSVDPTPPKTPAN